MKKDKGDWYIRVSNRWIKIGPGSTGLSYSLGVLSRLNKWEY